MNAIKAVIWDLAGVLLLTVKGTFNSLLAERLDAPLKEIERVMSTPENDLWDMDEIDDDTFYTFLLNELGMPMEKKSILRKFVLDDFYVDQELLTYIRNLHRSYSTALLTNCPYAIAPSEDSFRILAVDVFSLMPSTFIRPVSICSISRIS